MLRDVAALPSLRKDIELGGNAEQDSMKWVFNQEHNIDHVMYQPLNWYNGYEYTHDTPVVKDGDLLVHFAGYGAGKFPAMGKWLDRLDTDEGASELHVPLNKTDYPPKIKKFWSRLRIAKSLLEEAKNLANENYPNITDTAVVNKVLATYKELQEAVRDEAFNDKRIKKGIIDLNGALEAADKERARREKAIVAEFEYQKEETEKQLHEEQERKKALEAEKQKKEEAERKKTLELQEQRKKEEEQKKVQATQDQEAKQKAEAQEKEQQARNDEKGADADGGDSGSKNQMERAKEQEELKKQEKEKVKKEMMKKNDINEAVITDGKNQLERIEEARRGSV